jgi:transcriptional regulator with XRE-family HTH domain
MHLNSLETLLKKIGKVLGHLRNEKGFHSMREFADHYGLPVIQYWRVENGKSNIRVTTLLTLLAIHQLDLREFFQLVKDQNYWVESM